MPACPLPPTRPCPPHALNPVAFALPTGTCLPVRLPRESAALPFALPHLPVLSLIHILGPLREFSRIASFEFRIAGFRANVQVGSLSFESNDRLPRREIPVFGRCAKIILAGKVHFKVADGHHMTTTRMRES